MCFSQFSCEPLTLPNHLCYPPPFTCLSNYSHGQLLFFLFFSMLASFFSVLIFIVCFPLSFASLFFLLTSLHSFAVSLLLCITRLEIVSVAPCSDHLQWKSFPWIWQSKIYIGYISRAERIRLQRKKDAVAFSCNRSHWLAEDNYKIHPVTNYTETVSYSVFIGVRVYACFSLSVQLLV